MIRVVKDMFAYLNGDDEGEFTPVTVACPVHGTVSYEITRDAQASAGAAPCPSC